MIIFKMKFLVALIILGISLYLAYLVKNKILEFQFRTEKEKFPVLNILSHIAYISIAVIGTLTSLSMMGVDITALVAGIGITGFAVGFALKDIISNLIAGIMIILYNPFKIGEYIKVSGYEGKVVEINLRYTVLEKEGSKVLVPNATMFKNIITVSKV